MPLRYFLLILSTLCQVHPEDPESLLNPLSKSCSVRNKQTNKLEKKLEKKTKKKNSLKQIYTDASAIALESVRFSLLNFGSESPLKSIRSMWVEVIFATIEVGTKVGLNLVTIKTKIWIRYSLELSDKPCWVALLATCSNQTSPAPNKTARVYSRAHWPELNFQSWPKLWKREENMPMKCPWGLVSNSRRDFSDAIVQFKIFFNT